MPAYIGLGCSVTSGREDESQSVLRDYARYLEGFGAEVSVYRVLVGGELTGRILIWVSYPDTATRAVTFDRAIADVANNPYQKAIAASSPPLTGTSRIMFRSVEAEAPNVLDAPVVLARIMSAATGKRAEAEEAVRGFRGHLEALGFRASGLVIETAGGNSDHYVVTVAAESMTDLDSIERRLREHPGPITGAIGNGTLLPVNRRIDLRWDVTS